MDYFDILLAKKLSGGGGGDIEVETLNATENGTYNAGAGKAYNPVVVQLPLGEKAITANGEYNASADDLKGYSKVTVTVEGFKIKDMPTGAISSFDDGTDNPLKELKVSIVPVQSGSGDPSPSNPRPISGWSSVGVDVVGKNLFNENFSDYSTSVQYLYYGHLPKNQALNISFEDKDTSIDISGIYVGFGYNYTTGSLTNYRWSLTNGIITTNLTNITNLGDYGNTIIIYPADETTFNKLKARYNVKITIGSAVESYVPYNGTTIPISLGQTVYGGELDVTSGVLKICYKLMNAKDINWTLYAPTSACYTNRADTDASVTEEYPNGKRPVWCTIAKYKASGAMTENECQWGGTTNNKNLNIKNSYTTTLEDWQNYINENDVYIAYAVEPITVQLTPTQVSSILGTNNIWADCGDVISGKYFASL